MYVSLEEIEKVKDSIELIHGDGINYDYYFEVGYTRRYGVVLWAANAYDAMNENGFYTDTVKFAIKVPVDNPGDFVILLPARYHDHDGLKEYLDELYADVLVKERVIER